MRFYDPVQTTDKGNEKELWNINPRHAIKIKDEEDFKKEC
jgi:hypothetical protein